MRSTGVLPSHLRDALLLFIACVVVVGGADQSRAQTGPSLRSIDRPVRVTLAPSYQYYENEDGRGLSQISSHLTASVPVGQRFTVQARAGYARMGGDQLPQLRGLTDATGEVMYAQPVGEGSVVFSATVNIPVGKQKLNSDELRTTRLISRNFYDFRVSSYSNGLTLSPHVTWAFPVTDRLAVGVGAGYQHQRGFHPLEGMGEYVPGDGVGANGGIDYKLTQSSALGLDIAFKRFAPDELGGARQFDAGSRISGTVRYLVRSGFTTIRAVVRYANWEESTFGYRLGGPDRGQVIPSHGLLLGSYRTRLTDRIDLEVRASGHRYTETVQAGQKLFGRLYLSPSFQVSEEVHLAPHGTATYGSYLGLGGGLRITGKF